MWPACQPDLKGRGRLPCPQGKFKAKPNIESAGKGTKKESGGKQGRGLSARGTKYRRQEGGEKKIAGFSQQTRQAMGQRFGEQKI